MIKPLKLKAADAEDIQVISAVLQDAIVPAIDMTYRAEDRNFILVAQRLHRDGPEKERVCCAFNLRGVDKVQTQGFDPAESGQMLELLAVLPAEGELQLVFAENARIRLEVKDWNLLLEDFGESWPARCEPCHEAAETQE